VHNKHTVPKNENNTPILSLEARATIAFHRYLVDTNHKKKPNKGFVKQ
jgi:hypothetical protein